MNAGAGFEIGKDMGEKHCCFCLHCIYSPKGNSEMVIKCGKTAKRVKKGVITYQTCSDTRAEAGVTEACGPKGDWFEHVAAHDAKEILESVAGIVNEMMIRRN
jgi:hypothetical protein